MSARGASTVDQAAVEARTVDRVANAIERGKRLPDVTKQRSGERDRDDALER